VEGGEIWLLDAWFRHRQMRWLGDEGEQALPRSFLAPSTEAGGQ